jgi:hypothetical protein
MWYTIYRLKNDRGKIGHNKYKELT